MKFLIAFVLCAAAASAFVIPSTMTPTEAAELQQIIDAIYHPSTDPTTAAALEQMLIDILGINANPPIEAGPVIIDDSIVSEPGQDQISPILIGPAIIDPSIVIEPANYFPPIVQVIVNVNTDAPGNAVVVQKPEILEIEPTPVIIVDQPTIPESVIVAPVIIPEQPAEVPTPVIVPPIGTIPAVNLPGILN